MTELQKREAKKQSLEFLESMKADVLYSEYRARITKAEFEEMDFTIKSFNLRDEFFRIKQVIADEQAAKQAANTPVPLTEESLPDVTTGV